MIYKDAVGLLQSQGKFKINLGLDRMYAILKLLGNPQDKLKIMFADGHDGVYNSTTFSNLFNCVKNRVKTICCFLFRVK